MQLLLLGSQWLLPVHFLSNFVEVFQGQDGWICHLRFVFQLHGSILHGQHHSLKNNGTLLSGETVKSMIIVDQVGLVFGVFHPLHLPSHRFPGSLYEFACLLFCSGVKEDNVCHRFVWNACHRRNSKTFCCFKLFGAGVLKSQFVCCLTSCGNHSVKHVCRHHVSVKFERIEIHFLLTTYLGSN